ncbi:hypothetical protein I4U23_023562 [Adineta vaga]|nr:hypothetical protein I4U23_023562 [Adineta vaga]
MTYVYTDNVTSNEKFYSTNIVQEPQNMAFHIDVELLTSDISLENAVKPLVEILPEILEKVTQAKDNCKNPSDGLSSDESAAIYLFSMRSLPYDQCVYFVLNKTLRDQNHAQLNRWKCYLSLLYTALNRLPSTRITFHQEIEHDRTRQIRRDNYLVFWDFTFCSLSVKLPQSFKQTTFYTKTRTVFAFECRNAKFIERHSSDPSRNEYLLLPTQFQFVRYLDRRNDLEIIQVKEYELSLPLIDFYDMSSGYRSSIPPKTVPSSTVTTTIERDVAAYSNPRLKRLIDLHQHHGEMNLTYQNLTMNDMSIITQHAIIGKACRKLLLDNNYITLECMSILVTALSNNYSLKELYLRETGLYDLSVEILAQTLTSNISSIQLLSLTRNYITDQGVRYLAEMLKTNTNITQLYLADNQISKRGVKLLTDIIRHENKTLKYFDLDSNPSKKSTRFRTLVDSLGCIGY